ncbi:similar to Saccharomyces cerevisiae YMR098C ATP25 Mitochondrial protein required for the stability of Oli1p (Atp9p) mRNA and for the Oli1p ring formation [Maudiozyma barnettii]|uniref:ATPase synthesis protein 25 n=1 Tax=Maudiozyma barnettii TaxID=61262 RepID=A0A8H2VFC3_9SACH|nr:Atp25p [Kazachstania barnettii]CAB4254436.1 similar to Saccharomyces cerevisiae YMR098C ATP25 Mitochondrial protein required for the stability of Oli1p (Atp9p) mRNA and for the Oli1p ring formation [Kazachstania barnettii]CAD1782383.1 similar to Saccharomyces cerevisiae YMR098C ATP25 Mitochondrial protein required for the stability of Oli1p (Atp9p) mRNA and for the Oli1p ring formation [Kazachstania barnettii]
MLRLRTSYIPQLLGKYGSVYFKQSTISLAACYTTDSNTKDQSVPESTGSTISKDEIINTSLKQNEVNYENSIPWYLQMTKQKEQRESLLASTQQEIEFPNNSPQSLIKICNFLAKEQGLKDILVFDMRNSDMVTSKMADLMVVATAKSIKHCQNTYVELNKLIKQEFSNMAYLEGNINRNDERKKKKRLLRRNNLGGVWNVNKRNINTFESNEAWYMVDTRTDNIFVNILTDQRRAELNLEELYSPENEKHLWTPKLTSKSKTGESNELLEVSEENNVLSGLRRLAEQRRHYSTYSRQYSTSSRRTSKAINGEILKNLQESLHSQDFEKANIVLNSSISVFKTETLNPILQCINDTLLLINSTGISNVNMEDWVNIFDKAWPLNSASVNKELWDLRFGFLETLASSQPSITSMKIFIENYFKLKLYSNADITVHEITEFMKLTVARANSLQSRNGNRKLLRKENILFDSLLKLFVGTKLETRIMHNPEVLDLILRSMVMNHSSRLDSFPRVIRYLSMIPQLSQSTIISIIDILSRHKLWNELFKFWEERSEKIQFGNDTRPWNHYLKAIVDSKNPYVIDKFISKGHLLWILRYGVEISDEHKQIIRNMLNIVDPNNKKFKYQSAQFNL